MNDNFNVGILGCGMVGNYHILNIKKLIGPERIYLCDKSNHVLANTSKKHKIYNLINDYLDFINHPKINAIIICTPPDTHHTLVHECLKANKHTLVEKPIVINKGQLKIIESIIHEHPSNIIFMDCSARHSRLQPKFQFVKSVIDRGLLGEIYYIHHNVVNRRNRPGLEYHPNAKWFFQRQISGGGPMIDWGVYDMAFHLGLLNDKPDLLNVRAYLYNGLDNLSKLNNNFTVEEHGFCMMEFDSLKYYYERSSNAHNFTANETRLYGSKGGLKFNYLPADSNKIEFYYLDSQGHDKTECLEINMGNHTSYEADYFEMDQHFINCLRGKTKPILPISTTIKIMKIILQIYENSLVKF